MSEEKTKGFALRAEEMEEFMGPTGTNHLLAIAIDNYEHCPVLSNCVNDARGLIGVLKERYDFQDENIQTLFNEEATRPNIHSYLKGLKDRVKPEDNVIIYFSGHGETEDDVGYWVPVEAHPTSEWEFVSTNDIKSRLDTINSFHTFVIVDACFSGALFSSYRSVKAGNENKRSRLGLAASHTRERALDGTAGENSPFSTHLIKMLRENTGLLSAYKLAGEIIDEVYAATKGKQTPVFKPLDVRGDDSGQFVFRLKADEGSDWENCQKLGTLAAYEAFFAKYPEGEFAKEAQEKIALLRDEEAWQAAQGQNSIGAYLQYRKDNPDGQYRDQALDTIQQLEEDQSWQQVKRQRTIFEYEQYLEKYPSGRYVEEAQAGLQALLGGHAPPKQPAAKQPLKTPQEKSEKPADKPKEEKTPPQQKPTPEVRTDKPTTTTVPVAAPSTQQKPPPSSEAAAGAPINRKYMLIGGGILTVVVIVIFIIFSGGKKSADPLVGENQDSTALLNLQEGELTSNTDPQQGASDEPAVKKTPESTKTANKPAPASLSSSGVTFNGKTYRVVNPFGLTWMVQNLAYDVPSDSWCYNSSASNCIEYGRLYTWAGAKKACAAMGGGWRLPTEKEWRDLAKQYGGIDEDAGDGGAAAFKALSTREGFSAQLGGWRNADGNFKHLGTAGYYWSSTENQIGLIKLIYFANGEVSTVNNDPTLGFSCRCVK